MKGIPFSATLSVGNMDIIVMYQYLRDLDVFALAKRGKGCILGQNAAGRF
jgi:hypothetical protein